MVDFNEKDIDNMMAFVAAVTDICKDPGKQYTFLCPICGGQATAIKDSFNGHCHAACPTCNTRMME